ncbi:MAG: hypothetical protein LLG02_15205 [Pelosinus sp.]|nr:hypothetical protein [Pelosinus sp.]
MHSKVRWLTEVSMLAVFITITAAFKLPGLIPGTEYQLSAPIAVAICAVFGFSKYITAGLLSSAVGLILGTQTILNIGIAMIFRVVVGLVLLGFGRSWLIITLAGPVGSGIARAALGAIVGKAAIPLVVAAVPGMIFTSIVAWPMMILLKKVKVQKGVCLKNGIQH